MDHDVIPRALLKLLIIVPFFSLVGLSLIQFLLTRSILRILRNVAPETARRLSFQTGHFLIDSTFWVRPWKFRAFALSCNAVGDARLASRLAQYKVAYYVGLGIWIWFGLLFLALLIRFLS